MTDATLDRPPAHALLADGTTECIRPVVPGDHDQLEDLYGSMPPENPRLRSFAASRRSAATAADRACAAPRPGYRALPAETRGKVVGPAENDTDGSGSGSGSGADISIAVADELHRCGVGTLLVEHIVSAARAEGVAAFTADALRENHEVLRLFTDLGLRTVRRFEGPEVRCAILRAEDDTHLSAVEARGRTADVAGRRPLPRPDGVAVVGAGRRTGSVDRATLHHLREGGHTGRLFAVNPVARSILSVPGPSSVSARSRTPDLAVLAVPAAAVPATAEECGTAGVRALLVVAAGLEADQARDLRTTCRTHGMRLVGPGCLGIAHTDPAVAAVPDGGRPAAARRGRLRPGARGPRPGHRARRTDPPTAAPAPRPPSAPTALIH